MPATRQDLFRRLAELQIATHKVKHEPLFTVAESSKLERELPGARTKNLFLKDEGGELFLIVAASTTRVDLKALARTLRAASRASRYRRRADAARDDQLPPAREHGDHQHGPRRTFAVHSRLRA